MKKFLLLSAGFLLSAGLATATFAAVTADQLVTAYQADGFTAIEVTTGVTQIKVEAVKNGSKIEVIYDIASGEILKSEQKRAKAKDAEDTSVEVKSSAEDFTDASDDDGTDDQGHGNDDGAGHDAGDDHGQGDDDGAGHDAGDDHGGSGHGGSGHSGSDHEGSDGGSDGDSDGGED